MAQHADAVWVGAGQGGGRLHSPLQEARPRSILGPAAEHKGRQGNQDTRRGKVRGAAGLPGSSTSGHGPYAVSPTEPPLSSVRVPQALEARQGSSRGDSRRRRDQDRRGPGGQEAEGGGRGGSGADRGGRGPAGPEAAQDSQQAGAAAAPVFCPLRSPRRRGRGRQRRCSCCADCSSQGALLIRLSDLGAGILETRRTEWRLPALQAMPRTDVCAWCSV